MRSIPLSLILLAFLAIFAGIGAPALPAAVEEKPLDLTKVIVDDDKAKAEAEDAGAGDKKEFPVNTDENITTLAEGDIYRNDQKTFFKVVRISSKGQNGGSFVLQRTNGTAEPGQRFQRVQGAGPATIAASLTLLDLYIQGGPALHPIALLGVVTLVMTINCIWIFRRRRQIDQDLEQRGLKLLKAGDIEGFTDLAYARKGLFAVVCRAMVAHWHSSNLEDIKERVSVAASAQINRLRFPVRLLNVISVAAPLLGLLGTIIGMVIVFEGVASTTGAAKASILAAGIRVKLFSTAFALFVAIPSLFSFFFFNSYLNSMIAEVEILSERFIHRIATLKRREAVGEGAQDDDEEDDEDTDVVATSAEKETEKAKAGREDDDEDPPAPRPGKAARPNR